MNKDRFEVYADKQLIGGFTYREDAIDFMREWFAKQWTRNYCLWQNNKLLFQLTSIPYERVDYALVESN